jgi:RES domain-containing protein
VRYVITDLLKEWKNTPSANLNRKFAQENFYGSNQYTVMAIPSVMVPEEFNLVINPLHAAFAEAKKTIRLLGQFIAPIR